MGKVSTREYLETLILSEIKAVQTHVDDNKSLYDQRWLSEKEALDKAERQLNIRLNGMNEFRDQLRDQAATLLPRAEYNSKHEQLQSQIDVNKDQLVTARRPNWQVIITVVGIVITFSLSLYGLAIRPLQDQVDRDSILLQNIATNGSPITQERLNRLEITVYGKATQPTN